MSLLHRTDVRYVLLVCILSSSGKLSYLLRHVSAVSLSTFTTKTVISFSVNIMWISVFRITAVKLISVEYFSSVCIYIIIMWCLNVALKFSFSTWNIKNNSLSTESVSSELINTISALCTEPLLFPNWSFKDKYRMWKNFRFRTYLWNTLHRYIVVKMHGYWRDTTASDNKQNVGYSLCLSNYSRLAR